MVRLVLKLSPLAKAGILIVVVGVGLSIASAYAGAPWMDKAGKGVFAVGVVVYLIARLRMFKSAQKKALHRDP